MSCPLHKVLTFRLLPLAYLSIRSPLTQPLQRQVSEMTLASQNVTFQLINRGTALENIKTYVKLKGHR